MNRDTSLNTEFPELSQEQYEAIVEIAGKLEADGMDAQEATLKALDEVLNKKTDSPGGDPKKDVFKFTRVSDLPLTPPEWIIKDLIEKNSFNNIFGESASCKSFIGVEMACSVATGVPFFGLEVKNRGAVYYIAAEGRGGLTRRFHAWQLARSHSLESAQLFLNETPLQLTNEASPINAVAAIKKIQDETKTPPALIILDTWSRNLGGDDSNPGDAAVGVAAVDYIRSKFSGVAVVVIHHTGQANRDRSRGWSGLRAAVDTEFLVERGGDGIIRLGCLKNKEGSLISPVAFELRGIGLGIFNDDGEEIFSAVLNEVPYTDDPKKPSRARPSMGCGQNELVAILKKCIDDYSPKLGDPPGAVPANLWSKACQEGAGISRQNFYNTKKSLVRRGDVFTDGRLVWLP